MAQFHSSDKEPLSLYKLMIGCIVPRPIAWVATMGSSGVPNLAPFSFFNGVGSHPPTVLFSVGDRDGELKDTSRNLQEIPEFVVHMVSEELAGQMNQTCADFGAHVSEFEEAGLTSVPSETVSVPRVKEAQVTMECRMTQHLRIGRAPNNNSIIIGEVIYWHIDDAVLVDRGRIDPEALAAVGRMGGFDYSTTRDRFSLDRPVITDDDPRSIAAFKRGQANPPIPK